MSKLDALNRAFEKAFAHTATKETLMDLLACLGEELGCARIALFEINHEESIDNTHEWCREGTAEERDLLQNVPIEKFGSWPARLVAGEILKIRNLAEIGEEEPAVYELFSDQSISRVIVSKLAFHGKELGFFVLEDPSEETFEESDSVLPGMRYILSSLVYSDRLVHRLEKIGYTDRLTGVGNRASLQEYLESLDGSERLDVIYCDVLGWAKEDHTLKHLEIEQSYIRVGDLLAHIYDETKVFRVASEEFLVIFEEMPEEEFEERLTRFRNMLREENLLVALGVVRGGKGEASHDVLIRRAHLQVYDDKRRMISEKKEGSREEEYELADISLYRGDEFMRKAQQFLGQVFDEAVLAAVVDINYFKLYNDIFGRRAGNILLENIAEELLSVARKHRGLAGYLGGDNFSLLIPVSTTDSDVLKKMIDDVIAETEYTDGFSPAFGFYLSSNRDENVFTMYDRAREALEEIQGDYFDHYRFYNEEHFQHAKDEQLLLLDVKRGLANGEFTFYLQPQVNGKTGKIVGTEALVRWLSEDDVISPGRFIPALEKSGYIFAVDCYVWDKVAAWLRSILDRGIEPVPCSVNVSRVDFYFTDIAEHFKELIQKYDIPASLLGIEITESALTDNAESILEAVEKLQAEGFRILMDDFGSGTSSLSMLHTMNIDVLKTDVKFMSRKDSDSRAISIVEAVISMAHMIGMMVVTEGVETETQRDNLIMLGDNYVQGFFFYKPMPVSEFEKILVNRERIGEPLKKGSEIFRNHLNLKEIIREGMVSDTLLDNIIGAAAVYRETGGHFSLVQINDQYSSLTGIGREDIEAMEHFVERFHRGAEDEVGRLLHKADNHPLDGAEGVIDFERADGSTIRLGAKIFMLYGCEENKLYLSTLQEV